MTLQQTALYALEELKKAGAEKAACRASSMRKDEFNVEANKFSLLRTLFTDSLHLKAIKDGKKGVIIVNKTDKESVDKAVEDCISLTASSNADDAEDIAELAENKKFDQKTGGADLEKLFSRTKEFLEQLHDEYPKIVLREMTSEFDAGSAVYVNSNGVEFTSETESYSIGTMISAKEGDKSSSFSGYGASLSSLKVPFIDLDMHRTLLSDSEKSIDTRMVEGKFTGKVIVTPAASDLIYRTLIGCFLSDGSLIEGTSRWKDALGKKVTDSKFTMRAVPLNPAVAAGERFTMDGYESLDMDLIKDGVLKSFALSLYGSRKTGKPRALNTAFENIEIAAGGTPLDEMIKSIDRGILLNRFSGASPNPSGDISGVAKNSFLIENGKITDALKETMISFNIVDVLSNITAVSKERCCNGISILPWCCFDGITISGGS